MKLNFCSHFKLIFFLCFFINLFLPFLLFSNPTKYTNNEVDAYNKGTLYFMEKNYVLAYSFLQKAYLESPFDSNVIHNLRLSAQNIPNLSHLNEVETKFESLLFHPYFNWTVILLAILSFFYAVFWISLILRKRNITFHSIVFFILTLFFFTSWLSFDLYSLRSYSILLEKSNVFSQPNETSSQIQDLEKGKKMRVVIHENEWSQVIYSKNGHRGWIKTSLLLPLHSK